jgi:hypothetical protein
MSPTPIIKPQTNKLFGLANLNLAKRVNQLPASAKALPEIQSISPSILNGPDKGTVVIFTGTGFKMTSSLVIYITSTNGAQKCPETKLLDMAGGTMASCVPGPGTEANMAVTISVDGEESLITAKTPRLTYLPPLILRTLGRWAPEKSTFDIIGTGFVKNRALLCRTGEGTDRLPTPGKVISTERVRCLLGSVPMGGTRSVNNIRLYVSQDDGDRWSSALVEEGGGLKWVGGSSAPPRNSLDFPTSMTIGLHRPNNKLPECVVAIEDALVKINSDPALMR